MRGGGARRSYRRKQNRREEPLPLGFLAPMLLLLLVMLMSSPTLMEMSESLERRLNETMALQSVKYSAVNDTGLPYNASTRFNPKGMGQLYNVTNMFIDLVQAKQAYPEVARMGDWKESLALAVDSFPEHRQTPESSADPSAPTSLFSVQSGRSTNAAVTQRSYLSQREEDTHTHASLVLTRHDS